MQMLMMVIVNLTIVMTDYYIEAIDGNASDFYFPMVLDCDGNCAPISWIGDGYCDDGAYGIYDEDGEVVPINLWCEELNFDEGDCEIIDEGCTEGLLKIVMEYVHLKIG